MKDILKRKDFSGITYSKEDSLMEFAAQI